MLEEANKIWKFLDELAANDPEGYRTFIEKQVKEGRTGLSPPKPRFVICATLKGNKKHLIINYCEWAVVPDTKSEENPITVKCGDTFEVNGGNPIKPKMMSPADCYGSREQVLTSLGFMRRLMRTKEMKAGTDMVKEFARSLGLETAKEKQDDLVSAETIRLPNERPSVESKAPLIEELPAVADSPAVSIPWKTEVLVSAVKGSNETCANSLKITFNLPGVRSGSQCELDMTTDRLSLQVQSDTDKFTPLDLELPCKVDAKEAVAKFNPKRQWLVMTAPILLTRSTASTS